MITVRYMSSCNQIFSLFSWHFSPLVSFSGICFGHILAPGDWVQKGQFLCFKWAYLLLMRYFFLHFLQLLWSTMLCMFSEKAFLGSFCHNKHDKSNHALKMNVCEYYRVIGKPIPREILVHTEKKWSRNGSILEPFWKTAPLIKSIAIIEAS